MVQETDLVRDGINETREHLAEKLVDLEGRIREQVETVKKGADETIENVRGTVRMLSPRYQIEQNPLPALGVAVGAGLATGVLMGRRRRSAAEPAPERRALPPPAAPRARTGPSWWEKVADYFDDELRLVKGMAVAGLAEGLLSVVKEKRPGFAPHVEEIARSVQRKVGREGFEQRSES